MIFIFFFLALFNKFRFFTFSLILITLRYSDFMELGGINSFGKTNLGVFSSPVLDFDNLSYDEPITLTFDKVDQFISSNSDSRSPLEQMENQLKDYESVMDVNDSEQVAFLKDGKALLEQMRRNVEVGKASLEETNKYILNNGLIQDISQQTQKLFDRGSVWLSLTGTEQPTLNQETDVETIKQNIKVDQDKVNKSLENASPEKIAELEREHKAAAAYSQEKLGLKDPNIAEVTKIFEQGRESREQVWSERSELEKQLKDPSLTQEQRESLEQRIEKIDVALKLEDKIKDDKDFQDKIWSKLSKEQQESILADLRDDGKLTEESLQALNRATAEADETQAINEGFFALSKQGMKKVTGFTHEDYYEKYKAQMNLDKSKFIKTNIELKVYSRDSSYDTSSYSSNVANKNESDSSNSSTANEERREAAISQGLAEPESETKKMLAEQYGLDPSGHKLLISYLLNNDIVNAFEYAQEHGMASLEESLQETMNRLAFQEVPMNSRVDEFFNLSFV